MNLDSLINEAGNAWAEALKGKVSDTGSKQVDRGQLAQVRLQQAQDSLGKLYDDLLAAERAGDDKKVKEIKLKIKAFNDELENGGKKAKKYDDSVKIIQEINSLKGRIFFLIEKYLNLTNGVGLNGDVSTKKMIEVKEVEEKDEDGNVVKVKKVVGTPPSEAMLKAHYTALKNAALQLKKYESDKNTPRRYFQQGLARGDVLLRAIENSDPADVSFDIDDRGVPKTSDVAATKDRDGYSKLDNVELDKNGKPVHDISKSLYVKAIGKEMFNPEIYEELYPFLREFTKYRKDYTAIKNDRTLEHMNKDDKDNFDERYKKLQRSLKPKADEDPDNPDMTEYNSFRSGEKASHMLSNAKNERGEDGKIVHTDYSAKRYAGNLLKKQQYAQEAKDGQRAKTANQGWLEQHNIGKVNLRSKIKPMITAWMEEDKKNNAEPKKRIKFYGVMPGSAGQGAGTLIFIGADDVKKYGIPTIPNQFQFEGMYAFKAGKSFMNGDLTVDMEKYVESHSGRKADAWKQGVNAALKKFDASVMTESVNYFNY